MSKLRAALGDTPRGSHIIRTAYKIGYAFCADVPGAPSARVSAAVEIAWKKKQFMPLIEGVHMAGRDETCGLVIDAGTVSRNHARFNVDSGVVTVEDLGSTNGTYVNGVRISAPTPLCIGDKLSLGSEALQVRRRVAATLTVKVDEHKKIGGKSRA